MLVDPGVTTLLRLDLHPLAAPHIWNALAAHSRTYREDLTVVVNVADGPGSGRDPSYTSATARLRAAGLTLLGYVDLGYGIRPSAAIRADVGRWAGYPVHGVFLDRAPTSPFVVGPAAVALRAAQRAGLGENVLNPGMPPDPAYRGLGAAICTFEGTWREYLDWDRCGAHAGDGHLVHSVPRAELGNARTLMSALGAGFGMITDLALPDAYTGLPAWIEAAPALAA